LLSKKFKINIAMNLFRKYDVNKSGYINVDQYKQIAKDLKRLLALNFSTSDQDLEEKFEKSIITYKDYLSKSGK
jgi:Ca2+-binding EF-hand superfamily protein